MGIRGPPQPSAPSNPVTVTLRSRIAPGHGSFYKITIPGMEGSGSLRLRLRSPLPEERGR